MKKEDWETLEHYVTARMAEIYGEDSKLTVGSGNKLDDGDSKSPDWILECKHTGLTQNINILRKWLDKVEHQAFKVDRQWGLVRQANDTKITITLDFDVFIDLLKGEFHGKDSRNTKRKSRENPSSTNNGSGEEEGSREESDAEDQPKTWSRDDYDKFTSGGANPHGTSSLRPSNTTIRKRKTS